MCRTAAHDIQSALANHVGAHAPFVAEDQVVMGHASDPTMMQTPEPACFAHVARNPFEIVVSGYLYDMAESEPWLTQIRFKEAVETETRSCEPSVLHGRVSPM